MIIEKLWKSRIKTILGILAGGGTDHREIKNLASHIGADYSGRFLIELLQNAEDQCTKARLKNATLIIVRNKNFIGVLNQGEPFDEKGLDSITSIGMSTKGADESIGNKGIGFKAVYQISQKPEIYSSDSKAMSIFDGCKNALRMETTPFNNESFRHKAISIVEAILAENSHYKKDIINYSQNDDPIPYILSELEQAAPFKFPQPISNEGIPKKLLDLNLSIKAIRNMVTLIMLPLIEGEDTNSIIDTAIDELINFKNSAATMLFLNAINRIKIYDNFRGLKCVIGRHNNNQIFRLEKGAILTEVKTYAVIIDNDKKRKKVASWWLAKRKSGKDGDDHLTAEKERNNILEAVKQLPASRDNWDGKESIIVSVALPKNSPSDESIAPFGPTGKMCIGLPTEDDTGIPGWFNGPFHGNIARKGIDINPKIESPTYNRLIFNELKSLFWNMINHLKFSNNIKNKQSVALYFEMVDGIFSSELKANSDLAQKEIILDIDGKNFHKPSEILIPEEKDVDILSELLSDLRDLTSFEFVLPDIDLLRSVRGLLVQLSCKEKEIVADISKFYAKQNSNLSFLEFLALKNRDNGPKFWKVFLSWISNRFEYERLQNQKIIPVGLADLKQPETKVFFKPFFKELNQFSESDSSEVDEEEFFSESHRDLMTNLDFFDENCIDVRQKDNPKLYTPLASQLSPLSGNKLIRRPLKHEIINELLIPRLDSLCHASSQRKEALSLLKIIGQWLLPMEETTLKIIKRDKIYVPVKDFGSEWHWVDPTTVYFGKGWIEDKERENLLENAYGKRNFGRIVDWDDFYQFLLKKDDDISNWYLYLKKLGVSDKPKVIKKLIKKYQFRAYVSNSLAVEPDIPCPYENIDEEIWISYLDFIKNRPARFVSSYIKYRIKNLTWVDGLENQTSRPSVMKLILENHSEYDPYCQSSTERSDGTDPQECIAFWIFAIRNQKWEIIPSNTGILLTCEDIWLLSADDQRRKFISEGLVSCIPEKYLTAKFILQKLKIFEPEKASVADLIARLQKIVVEVIENFEADISATKMLVSYLYQKIQERYADEKNKTEDSSIWKNAPIPMLQGEKLVPLDLSNLPLIYVIDDIERTKYIAGFENAYVLPLKPDSGVIRLKSRLSEIVGKGNVKFTSEVSLDTGFQINTTINKLKLSEYFEKEFSDIDILSHLAALLAYGRPRNSLDPRLKQFKERWVLLNATQIVTGLFPEGSNLKVIFDEYNDDGPVLQVAYGSDPYEILESTWQIAGLTYRDTWNVYINSLQSNKTDDFFKIRDIGENEFDVIESVIQRKYKRDIILPILYVLWRKKVGNHSVQDFLSKWENVRDKKKEISNWLSITIGEIEKIFIQSININSEKEIDAILKEASLTLEEWQDARHSLGMYKFKFNSIIKNHNEVLNALVAFFMVESVRKYKTTDLDRAKTFLLRITKLHCPDKICESFSNEETIIKAVLAEVKGILFGLEHFEGIQTFEKAIDLLDKQNLNSIGRIHYSKTRHNELHTFRSDDQNQRSRSAKEAINNILRVTEALSLFLGEKIDKDSIINDSTINVFIEGWWANRYTALRALQKLLFLHAPLTAKALSKKRAFYPPRPWRDLWEKFPELDPPGNEKQHIKEKEKETLLGVTETEDDINIDLSKGSNGDFGNILSGYANDTIDFLSLANKKRAQVTIPDNIVNKSGRRIRIDRKHDKKEKERIGLIGEAFVYESFLKKLPNFDYSCWISENREKYGFEAPIEMGHGYDFQYNDTEGLLSVHAKKCFIEVKSSADSGERPFPISANEWAVAEKCYSNVIDSLYVIVRVRNVKTKPEIFDHIINPVKLWHDGFLAITNKDLNIHLAYYKTYKDEII